MEMTPDFVRHVARLARLRLGDDEVAALAPQLARILEHVARIQEVETGDHDPAALAPVEIEDLRGDEPGPTLDRRQVVRVAPAHDGAFFVVPRILEEEA